MLALAAGQPEQGYRWPQHHPMVQFDEAALANGCAFDVDLVSGRYAVDAKSIMGIFSLNLDKPVKLVVHSDGSAAEDFVDAVKKFAA